MGFLTVALPLVNTFHNLPAHPVKHADHDDDEEEEDGDHVDPIF